MQEQAPGRTYGPRKKGAQAGQVFTGLVTPGGPRPEQSASEGLHPTEGTHAGAGHEELQPKGRIHVE